jgi:hypothetical protein
VCECDIGERGVVRSGYAVYRRPRTGRKMTTNGWGEAFPVDRRSTSKETGGGEGGRELADAKAGPKKAKREQTCAAIH